MRVSVSVLILGLLYGGTASGQLVRQSISTLTPNQIESLRHGIQVMQGRDPSDPTSWVFQANLHSTVDQPITQQETQAWNQCQHGSFYFFSWHRMYLYYFERILRKASGDPALTLPYWNYTDPAQRALPLPYRVPAVQCPVTPPTIPGCNPFFVSQRAGSINAGASLPQSAVDFEPAFTETAFEGSESFGGAAIPQPVHFAGADGKLEQTPHNVVHVLVGGWMANPDLSARDPVFLLHHANIDRLWKRWLDRDAGRQNPTSDQVWMNTMFSFYDENGHQEQLRGTDILDTIGQLNYCYDDDPGCTPGPPPPTNCFVVKLNCQHEATMACDPTPNTLTLSARIGNSGPWSPVGYTVGTPPNPPASVVYDGVILPGPAGPRNGIQYQFLACAVPSSGKGTCTFPTQDTLVPPAGCPGGPPPPGGPPSCKVCVSNGCICRHGGGCICE